MLERFTTEKFIEKAILEHGDKYNYRLVMYKNMHSKVEIICNKHKSFMQSPRCHLNGSGCPKCIGKNKTTKEVVKDLFKVHGDKYDYSLVEYKDSKTKIKIICKEHGLFEQLFIIHLRKIGCPKCGREKTNIYHKNNPIGWNISKWSDKAKKSKNFDSFKVYIIKCWNETETFYKIGRTFTNVSKRFPSKRRMPYKYEIIKQLIFDNAKDCFNKETELKRLNKEYRYLPKISFGGMYECFRNLYVQKDS
ncbi:MAG: hypothetical protein [Caudoviricetes sp.]|nr:MAG: hypothetical protein [Caudoviricetes sp.]